MAEQSVLVVHRTSMCDLRSSIGSATWQKCDGAQTRIDDPLDIRLESERSNHGEHSYMSGRTVPGKQRRGCEQCRSLRDEIIDDRDPIARNQAWIEHKRVEMLLRCWTLAGGREGRLGHRACSRERRDDRLAKSLSRELICDPPSWPQAAGDQRRAPRCGYERDVWAENRRARILISDNPCGDFLNLSGMISFDSVADASREYGGV